MTIESGCEPETIPSERGTSFPGIVCGWWDQSGTCMAGLIFRGEDGP